MPDWRKRDITRSKFFLLPLSMHLGVTLSVAAFREVEYNLRTCMLDLFLQYPEALRLQSTNQPKRGALVAVSFFNLEGHLESSIAQNIYCKDRATARIGPHLDSCIHNT